MAGLCSNLNMFYGCHFIKKTVTFHKEIIMFNKFTGIVALALFLGGCGNTTKTVTVQPVSSFSNGSTVPKQSDQIDAVTYYDFGFGFTASKAGKITQVGIALPSNETYKVSIWDGVTKTLINQYNVTQITPGTFVYKTISPVNITANRNYFISVLANDYSRYYNDPNVDFMPFNRGPISIQYYSYDYYATYPLTQNFPDTAGVITDYFAGPVDFVFEYEE